MTTLQTERTTVRRLAKRGNYDREVVNAIVDEALLCHVGFVVDRSPVVIPTIHIDGLVLAREVTDRDEKLRVFDALVEHVMKGRSADARKPNEAEIRSTLVLALPIEEASAKIRTGGPVDDEEDYKLPIWAGVLPMKLVPDVAITDERSAADVPDYVRNCLR